MLLNRKKADITFLQGHTFVTQNISVCHQKKSGCTRPSCPGDVSFSVLVLSLQQVAAASGYGGMVRPVTGADVGIRRAEIRPGLREVVLCKDQDKKIGLRLRAIDNVSLPQPRAS